MHYYKRNLGDYAKKAGRLSMLQHGSYTLLIDSCYDREQFPTLEQAIEWTWASSTEEIEAVKFVLSKFFVLTVDGTYVQDRILQELLEYQAKSDTNKRIANERETKRKENSTKRAQVVNEAPPNHKPITNNQEPLTNNHIKTKKPTTATRLPIDWQPSETDYLFAKQERPEINPRSTADQFRDYWIAKSGKDATKADWSATWRNWVRRQTSTPSKQSYESSADKTRKTIEGLTGRVSNEQRDFIDIN